MGGTEGQTLSPGTVAHPAWLWEALVSHWRKCLFPPSLFPAGVESLSLPRDCPGVTSLLCVGRLWGGSGSCLRLSVGTPSCQPWGGDGPGTGSWQCCCFPGFGDTAFFLLLLLLLLLPAPSPAAGPGPGLAALGCWGLCVGAQCSWGGELIPGVGGSGSPETHPPPSEVMRVALVPV